MIEEGFGEVQETKVDLDTIFPTGYVVEFSKGQYFQTWRKQRILCTGVLFRAWYFPTTEAAESFVKKKLGFIGIDIHICLFAWILISWEGIHEVYWQGEFYGTEDKEAVRFLSYHDAEKYQRKKSLQESGIIELHRFEEKQLQLTAA